MSCIDKTWLKAHPDVQAAALREQVRHPLDRAHPYPPGSGPPGQTCGTCAKLCARQYSKTYFKCHVLMKFWSCGPATDIRKKDPACLCWEPRIDKIELVSTAGRHGAGQYPRPLIMSRRGRRRKVNETQTGTPGA